METNKDFNVIDYQLSEPFRNQWALVSAGNLENHNACTVSWGSIGTLWTRPGSEGYVITIYLHPARFTTEFLKENNIFAVSFFPLSYRKALGYMGSHSGRDEDKEKNAGLTPLETDGTVTYKEASVTFICKKIYAHQFAKEDIALDVQEYYKANPKVYPPDENGQWQPHFVFVGEIIKVRNNKEK